MSLTMAKSDWKRFVNGGFGVTITMTPPNSQVSKSIKAIASKHHNSISSDGIPINSKNVHITFIEADLLAQTYTIRNAAGEVALTNHRVSFPDSNGTTKNYIIKETMPDETIGAITCQLSEYAS